jgi:2,3-bisphosphoglycerate-independent phosphoglycerate mutase
LRLLFIFLDGVGLGADLPSNPFVSNSTPGLDYILEGRALSAASSGFNGQKATLLGLDAVLGVSGLPQSATGQASIFTGSNAPAYLGSHANGFPGAKLRRLLATRGIFRELKRKGFNPFFANAYRPPFFELLKRGLPGERYSCSTLVVYYGGLTFNTFEDLNSGKALFMDITNELPQKMGYDLPLITPEEGAHRLIEISSNYDFTMFEYFLTDLAGHMGEEKETRRVISIVDRFIGALARAVDPDQTLLIMTSDHGNIEDLSTKEHNLNQVPALLIGKSHLRKTLAPQLKDLTDLMPAVVKALDMKG